MADEVSASPADDILILAYVLVPVTLVLLLLACVYVLCSKRFRLNWYEQSLLEESRRESTARRQTTFGVISEKSAGYTLIRDGGATVDSNHTVRGGGRGFKPLKPIVEVIKSLKKLSTRLKASSDSNLQENGTTTEWIVCSRKPMGSSPSSPVNEHVDGETFWVPPTVIDRKRAQSLIPTIPHNDSEEDGSSGTVTPASLGGTREFTYAFQSTPLINTDGLPSPNSHGNRQRRASMQDAIDFRKIDSKLYDRRHLQRQQSVASIEEEQLGTIGFCVDFNKETRLLTVYLIEAENLVSRDFSGTADPYCKVCLLPDKRTELQSKIHRKTTSPIFDEEFIFEVDPDIVESLTLELLLFDYDQYSRDECIGQVKLPFEGLDLSQRQTIWRQITHREESNSKENGDLIFSLGYLSSAERLTVVVMKARNLRHMEDGKITMDPYVKITLSYGTGKKTKKKKKTSSKHNVFTPVWNEALTFSLSRDHLQTVSLDLSVFHDNKIGNDELLGHVKISRESAGDERLHWDELVNCRSAVARWHALS